MHTTIVQMVLFIVSLFLRCDCIAVVDRLSSSRRAVVKLRIIEKDERQNEGIYLIASLMGHESSILPHIENLGVLHHRTKWLLEKSLLPALIARR